MWRAEIIEKRWVGDRGWIAVEFSQLGSETVVIEYLIDYADNDVDWLKRRIYADVRRLETIDKLFKDVPAGVIDYIPETTPPTQDELDEAEFVKLYKALWEVEKAIDAGLLTELDAKVVALKARLVELFKPKYVGLE